MKRNAREKAGFIKQKKILKLLTLILFCFVLMLAHIVAFASVSGKAFTLANASEAVMFDQLIRPLNPIEKMEPLVHTEKKTRNLNSANFRLVSPIEKQTDELAPDENSIKTGPVVTFSGTSLYPNSQVLLSLHSDPFFSATLSDDQGRWNWTNYARPLDVGSHVLSAYSIAPVEIVGKRDVFVQKYAFTVADSEDLKSFNYVSLGDSNHKEKDDLDKLIQENNLDSVYIFNAILPGRTEYNFGDDIKVELLFSPMGNGAKNQATIDYSIFSLNADGVANSSPIAEFSDHVNLDGGGYFVKNIKLKEEILSGNYVMKINARIGENNYYQAFEYKINAKELMTIGSNVITVEKFGQVMVFNVLFIVVILVGVISLIMVEFKRYAVYRPVDERMLKSRGYFTK